MFIRLILRSGGSRVAGVAGVAGVAHFPILDTSFLWLAMFLKILWFAQVATLRLGSIIGLLPTLVRWSLVWSPIMTRVPPGQLQSFSLLLTLIIWSGIVLVLVLVA